MTDYAKMIIAKHDAKVASEKNHQLMMEQGVVNPLEEKQDNNPEEIMLPIEYYDKFMSSTLKIV